MSSKQSNPPRSHWFGFTVCRSGFKLAIYWPKYPPTPRNAICFLIRALGHVGDTTVPFRHGLDARSSPALRVPILLFPDTVTLHAARVKFILFMTSFALLGAVRADSLDQLFSTQGRLIITQFVSAPFPHPSRAEGRKYQNEFFPADKHYADSTVAVFIPKDFRETGRVDFVVHFHGWRNTVAGTLQQYKLIEQLVASGKNAVLIVPEGPHDAPDSAGGKLEEPDGFKRFMDEVIATLRKRGVFKRDFVLGDIILSGHSGGYLVMSAIVDHGGLTPRVKEVWLFDALYAQGDKFLAWSQQPGGRLVNIYTDNGGTKVRTEEMMTALKERGTNFLAATDREVTTSELRTNKFIFLHTDMGHNDVLEKRKTFGEFLKTSFLEDCRKD
jgi:hypothetical protein